MKKKIQALACAAMLAVGGFNVWTAMDINDSAMELQIEGVEALADGGDNQPVEIGYWETIKYMFGVMGTSNFEKFVASYPLSGGGWRVTRIYKCEADGTYTEKCKPLGSTYSTTVEAW